MDIVRFYRGDPNAPKTTQGAHLGANAIITCKGKLLLEKRRDCNMWGLVGGGVKRRETALQAICREIYEELGLRILLRNWPSMVSLDGSQHIGMAAFGAWLLSFFD